VTPSCVLGLVPVAAALADCTKSKSNRLLYVRGGGVALSRGSSATGRNPWPPSDVSRLACAGGSSLPWRGRSLLASDGVTEARRGLRLGLSRPRRFNQTVRRHPRGGRCFIYRPPWPSNARPHATSRRCAAASWPSLASMQPSWRAFLLLCAGGVAAEAAAVCRALRGVRPDKPSGRQRGATPPLKAAGVGLFHCEQVAPNDLLR
jgi:hypothetical protein